MVILTDTAFRQQRLKAWQPILTPKTVLPLFFAIGIIFAPIGGLLLYASAQVQELRIDYTDCATSAPLSNDFGPMDSSKVTASFKSSNSTISPRWRRENTTHTYRGNYTVANLTRCILEFQLPEDLQPPVLFYYHLTNFYQNHRRYVKSFYDKQLKGDAVTTQNVKDSDCTPLTVDEDGKPYYPCGLIANSLFNDTFDSPILLTTGNSSPEEAYNMTTDNVAWSSDTVLYGNLSSDTPLTDVRPPPNWQKQYPNGQYTAEVPPPDLQDPHFMVWMRTAGLPSFSKLYMRNDTTAMRTGTYSIDIISEFPTSEYQGTKSIIITTKTVIGGKNPFLGIAYIVVGGICIVLGGVFTVTHLIKPRKLGDHTYLSWNQVPKDSSKAGSGGPATGMSTGRDMA
ncbi:lem3 cdc50 family protein [Xylariales sp. AK1849]|nr:lem3 cdc50 family protein [Xylariales sp. AK1849]